MGDIFLKLLNMSIIAGWLILAVLCIRLIFKKIPKWVSCLLWGIVAIRLICPFSIESRFSILPSAEPIRSSTVVEGEVQNYIPSIDSHLTIVENTINPMLTESFAYNESDSVAPLQVVTHAAGFVWCCGMLLLIICAVVSAIRLYKLVREAVCVKDNIYICDAVKSPFILGIIRPRVYLPSALREKEMNYIVAHESAHLKRKDHWWKALGYLLLCIYWFHPLCWAAYALFCKDIELACDEKVAKDMTFDEKKEYSKVLLSCARQRSLIMVCPLAFGEVGVKERVKSVLNYKKPALWIMIAAAAVLVILAICFLTDPGKNNQSIENADVESGSIESGSIENGNMESGEESPEQLINRWAQAFVNRDGETIASLASLEVKEELGRMELLMGSEGQYSFGLSSPWPRDVNTDYTAHIYEDIGTAEIYYYAQTSDPHVFVWRETLTYEKEGDSYIVMGEELTYYDNISSGAEYAEAYQGRIDATMIDYTWNGLGEALNDNAASSNNDVYKALLSPESAAVSLLNLSTDPKDISISIYDGGEETGMVGLEILFLQDQYTVTISMIQPYGMYGIWVPADYRIDVESRFMDIPWEEIEAIPDVGYYDSSRYNNVICIGEIPKYDIRVYGYNDDDISGRGVAIYIAGDVNYFDWFYTSPQNIMPNLYWDEDERQLQMAFHIHTGTGHSAEDLVILQQYDTGTLVPHYFTYNNYTEILSERIEYSFDNGSRELTLTDIVTGREVASVTIPEGEITGIECGNISYFELGESIKLFVRPGFFRDGNAISEYEGMPVLEFEIERDWVTTAPDSMETEILFTLGELVGIHQDEE